MITYNFGNWGCCFLARCHGSVSRKGLALAIPSCAICLWMHHYYHDALQLSESENISVTQVWAGYNWAIAFLLTFRTTQAYGRYWEGVSLLQQVRGEWFNATSSLIAFCAPEPEIAPEVERFQHLLVRLVSLMYCAGLQTVSDLDDAYRVIDNEGVEDSSLLFLEGNSEKCEIILQWIQRLIIDNTRSGVVPVPAPIVSRAFQELSRGIVNLNNARKIADIPFPFPYAQMCSIMLGAHVLLAPIVAAALMNSIGWAMLMTFIPIWAFWGLNYIAAEIEAPFGDDPNDLPLVAMMDDMNTSLWMLLDRRTQLPPSFSFDMKHTQFKSTVYTSNKKTFYHRTNTTSYSPAPGRRSLKPTNKRRSSTTGWRKPFTSMMMAAHGGDNGTSSEIASSRVNSLRPTGAPHQRHAPGSLVLRTTPEGATIQRMTAGSVMTRTYTEDKFAAQRMGSSYGTDFVKTVSDATAIGAAGIHVRLEDPLTSSQHVTVLDRVSQKSSRDRISEIPPEIDTSEVLCEHKDAELVSPKARISKPLHSKDDLIHSNDDPTTWLQREEPQREGPPEKISRPLSSKSNPIIRHQRDGPPEREYSEYSVQFSDAEGPHHQDAHLLSQSTQGQPPGPGQQPSVRPPVVFDLG